MILNCSYSFSKSIEFSGSITQKTAWNYDTVKITGNVTVNTGSDLTIAAGTLVRFQGYYKISSLGSLHLLGSKEKNIVFTINDTTGYSLNRANMGWGGLELKYNWDGGAYGNNNPNDSTIIDYCVFEYSKAGAIAIENFSKIRISNSVFRRNYGSDGSGINLYYSNASVSKCSFFENYSYNSGGAMHLSTSGPKIYNSSFINNKGSQGGAIDITGDNAMLVNNIFYYNSTYNGGAIKFHGFGGILANNLICCNSATYGGGAIYGGSGPVLMVNNTICNNSANYAPGIYVSDDYYIINSIIWGNSHATSAPEQIYLSDPRDNPTVQNCVIEKAQDYNLTLFTKFEKVYFDDPKILKNDVKLTYNRDSILSHWSIDSTSICFNKGTNTYYRSVELNLFNDLALKKRISKNTVDIGAIEYQYPDVAIPTSVTDLRHDYGTVIYPNPTNGKIWIVQYSTKTIKLELFDLSGRLIQTDSFSEAAQFDLSQYHPGIYILWIWENNKRLKTIKIVKY